MEDTYTILRVFADSWVLLFMFAFFIGVIFWALAARQEDPPRHREHPVPP
jgi:cbb3-type cytochrome oxidase subunit 3